MPKRTGRGVPSANDRARGGRRARNRIGARVDSVKASLDYSPVPADDPAPGEIVWAWVPYENDPDEGKDRPVLVIGHADGDLLVVMLSSRYLDVHGEARRGRQWVDIGSGSWDPRGRRSAVRVDLVLQVDAGDVRRAGAILDRDRFDEVAAELHRIQRWS